LLNYCGIRTDFIEYTVDRNPYKQGKFLPGTHIPIHPPEKIGETRPDYVLILPWNLKDEIMDQLASIRSWGGQFVVPIPDVKVYPCPSTICARASTTRPSVGSCTTASPSSIRSAAVSPARASARRSDASSE